MSFWSSRPSCPSQASRWHYLPPARNRARGMQTCPPSRHCKLRTGGAPRQDLGTLSCHPPRCRVQRGAEWTAQPSPSRPSKCIASELAGLTQWGGEGEKGLSFLLFIFVCHNPEKPHCPPSLPPSPASFLPCSRFTAGAAAELLKGQARPTKKCHPVEPTPLGCCQEAPFLALLAQVEAGRCGGRQRRKKQVPRACLMWFSHRVCAV